MWPNARPPSRTSPGDHFNNNSAGNPYSRNATVQKPKPGRQSTDPWDWGWEDNSAQQDDWNNGWNQAPTPNPPNVIPNPAPHFYPSRPEKNNRGTPDLIPDKINNVSRGNMMHMGQQPFNQVSNASEFFENIDLGRQGFQPPTLPPPMYSSSDPRRPPQSSVPPSYPMFQPVPPQSTVNRHPTPANYFQQPNSPHPSNSEPLPYYQQTPQSYNTEQAFQYYQTEPNNQTLTQDYSSNYFNKSQPIITSNNYYEQNSFSTNNDVSYQSTPSANPVEVENIEVPVAPTERAKTPALYSDSLRVSTLQNLQEIHQPNNVISAIEPNIPDNQETVPDEEHLRNLPQKLSQMKINTGYHLETWNNSPGWENQEVAPRCELDRNQYLETGQLTDSNGAEEVPQETDNNDEGEALPPPGLHRLVTGQGTESISQRSVLGQLPSVSQNTSSGFVRHVPGQPTPSASPEPTSLERMVLGQQNVEAIPRNSQRIPGQQINEEIPRNSQRMVPGQQNVEDTPRNTQRMVPGQKINEEIPRNAQRMVVGQQNNEEIPSSAQRLVSGHENGEEILMNSQRVVTGHQNSEDTPMNSQRILLGQQISDEDISTNSSVRMVPGQQNNEDILMNSSQRMVPGHQEQDSQLAQNFSINQELQTDFQRLVPGQTQNGPMGPRMIPGQLSDDESNVNTNDMERMIPGGVSEHENSFPGDGPEDERMGPGGMSDDSRSQSISMDDDAQNSSERMIPGMTMPAESSQQDSQAERLVNRRVNTDAMSSSQDGGRHLVSQRNGGTDSTNQSRPSLQRLVLGQTNSEVSNDKEPTVAKVGDRGEETIGVNPLPVMNRMVVGQFREKEGDTENDKEKETIKSNERDDDSDSDYRSDRRRHRHRKETYEEERKERDYSSEREFRGNRREDRREYRKKRDGSYNRSPEYRSDHEEYDRNEYRDRRDRERRDRPKERDRRRRSPDYSYRDDPYYRDDPRKLPHRERDRRYYDFEEDPYYYRENRSRPSSRSGSEYRRHRDYPPRQQYYPDQGGGMSNYMHYYQIQQYYENMRRNDPQAYALWYERYMAEKFGTTSNDRASVHSGRSSANENSQLNETEEVEREGVKADDVSSHRSTPPLYSLAHIRGQFNSLGQLIVVNPHDPYSYGEHQAMVTVFKVAGPNAADNPDTLEFLQNPGPFISGVTHKNTVLQYLKKHSDLSSHSSEKLLYELIRLVIKLNGVVDMIDVADLLMESYRNDGSERDNFDETVPDLDESPPLSPHQITSKFRDLLLEGNKTEALEWAIKNKDWGHALFLASKMDTRTHNNVMLRFANGLQNNDPLQTLYQLMSGHEPQAATCAADKKWGDWRPHLAMMLSNRTSHIELDRKAILTLGDSLAGRGRLFAAHFCYLTAQLEFSNYSDHHAKMVLLGTSPDKPFSVFASCRAIMLTLCYEFAKQLSMKDWCIPTLRPYKFLLASRLLDHGNISAALAYLEALAQDIVRLPRRDDKPLAQLIVDLADRIKCADTTLAFTSDPANDPEWLSQLKFHIEETNDPNYLSAHMAHGVSTSTVSDLEPISGMEPVTQPVLQDINQTYTQEANPYQTESNLVDTYNHQEPYYDPSQNNYYNPSQPISNLHEVQQTTGYITDQYTHVDGSSNSYWATNTNTGWSQQQPSDLVQEEQPVESAPVDHQPQISVKPGFGYFANSEENIKPQTEQDKAQPSEKPESKEKSNRRSNKAQQSGSGWFGGIWDKLALRPKNQMKLPDDKDPSIVWDEKTKRWMNKDASEDEQTAQLKPPPKASELNGSAVPTMPLPVSAPARTITADANGPVANTGLPPPAPSAPSINKYKLQRGKGMRGNYVDVLGSNKTASGSSATNSQPFTTMPQAPVTNFFVPAPLPGNENAPVDFLSPSGPVSYEPSSSKAEDQPVQGGYGKGNPGFYNPGNYQ